MPRVVEMITAVDPMNPNGALLAMLLSSLPVACCPRPVPCPCAGAAVRGAAIPAVEPGGVVRVPAGTFTRGSPPGVGLEDEHPQRELQLDAFTIDRTDRGDGAGVWCGRRGSGSITSRWRMMKTMTIATFTAAFLVLAMTGPAAGDPPARPTVEVLFARQVQDHKPVDPATTFSPGKLYCWNRLTSSDGNYLIAHHWLKNGRRVRHQPIEVRGKQWVTWSQFKVTPGSWTVRVTDEAGLLLQSASFTVQ